MSILIKQREETPGFSLCFSSCVEYGSSVWRGKPGLQHCYPKWCSRATNKDEVDYKTKYRIALYWSSPHKEPREGLKL